MHTARPGIFSFRVGDNDLPLLLAIFRFGASLFSELKNAIFSMVAQSAIRSASLNVFSHLHNLDLDYHNKTPTGALVKSIDRGAKGIQIT